MTSSMQRCPPFCRAGDSMCREAPASRGFNTKGCLDWADAAFADFLTENMFSAAFELSAGGPDVPMCPAPATVPVQPSAALFFDHADSLDLFDFLAAPAEVPVFALHPPQQPPQQQTSFMTETDAAPMVPSLDLDSMQLLSFDDLAALAVDSSSSSSSAAASSSSFAAQEQQPQQPTDEPLVKRARGRPRQPQQLTPAQEQLLCVVAAEPVRKRKPKVAVPPELRDARYYEQRQLNTERAALSRQRRRLEETQQKSRMVQLNTEHTVLQDEVALLHAELDALRAAVLAKLQRAA